MATAKMSKTKKRKLALLAVKHFAAATKALDGVMAINGAMENYSDDKNDYAGLTTVEYDAITDAYFIARSLDEILSVAASRMITGFKLDKKLHDKFIVTL